MQILYECRGITLVDTGDGYVVRKDGLPYLDGISTPREAVISFCTVLEMGASPSPALCKKRSLPPWVC